MIRTFSDVLLPEVLSSSLSSNDFLNVSLARKINRYRNTFSASIIVRVCNV